MRALKITGYILIFLLAAYSAIWYFQGKANLRQVEAWLDTFTDAPFVKAMDYESLTLKGYPFKIIIEMNKPKLTLDSKALSDTFLAQSIPLDKRMKKGTLEMYSEGSFQLQTNITGNHYLFKSIGDIHSTHESDKHNFHYRQSADENWIDLKFNTWEAMWGFSNLETLSEKGFGSFEEFLEKFEKIHFYAKNAKVVNDMNDELLYGAKELSYGANYKEISEQIVDAGLFVDVKDIEITEAYENEMKALMESLEIPFHSQSLQSYNHANAHVFANYYGPKDFSKDLPDDFPVKLQIDLAFNNDLYNHENKGHVLVSFKGGELNDVDVDFEADALFQPQTHQMLVDLYQSVLMEVESEIPQNQSPYQAQNDQAMDFVKNHLEDMVPKFHELGKIHGDLKFYVKQMGASMLNVDLKALSFINELYGLVLNGKMNFSMLMPIPSGQMQFKMTEFDVFFERIGKYVDLLIAYHNENELQAPPHLDDKLIPKIKSFLRTLAQEQEDSKDVTLVFDFQMTEPFVKVGGKSEQEVAELFMELFPPEPPPSIPPSMPSAGGDSPE